MVTRRHGFFIYRSRVSDLLENHTYREQRTTEEQSHADETKHMASALT
jgi:hypothetical protein